MASGTNTTKAINHLIRRVAFAYELTEPTINRHKGKLIELLKEKADKVSRSEIARKARVAKGYYTREISPPICRNDMDQIRHDIQVLKMFLKERCYKQMTVKQAWLMLLVCVEVGLWFFLGETIGKSHIVGYKVD